MRELNAKIILLGEATVGKSSIILQYFESRFEENIPNTIGTAFLTKTIERNDTFLKMNVWDTCGQERFMAIASIYYRDANVILLVVDCTNEKSLEQAEKYLEEIHSNASSSCTLVLVVNKIDMLLGYREGQEVDERLKNKCDFYDKIKKFKSKNNFDALFWISAKDGSGVKDVFDYIANGALTGQIRITETGSKANAKKLLAQSITHKTNKKSESKCC